MDTGAWHVKIPTNELIGNICGVVGRGGQGPKPVIPGHLAEAREWMIVPLVDDDYSGGILESWPSLHHMLASSASRDCRHLTVYTYPDPGSLARLFP